MKSFRLIMTIFVNYKVLNKKSKHFLLAGRVSGNLAEYLSSKETVDKLESARWWAVAVNDAQSVFGSCHQADRVNRLGNKIEIAHFEQLCFFICRGF